MTTAAVSRNINGIVCWPMIRTMIVKVSNELKIIKRAGSEREKDEERNARVTLIHGLLHRTCWQPNWAPNDIPNQSAIALIALVCLSECLNFLLSLSLSFRHLHGLVPFPVLLRVQVHERAHEDVNKERKDTQRHKHTITQPTTHTQEKKNYSKRVKLTLELERNYAALKKRITNSNPFVNLCKLLYKVKIDKVLFSLSPEYILCI